ncbi:RNA-binding protein 42-like [Centruroides sculpturatus]|uniref:RNA-binding protein 42-like n=1 Tax=Centruroides sculpturatus TaxID=218467 RepID=UPI000C6D9909|nr:RNA-binding protein 42-like [Centruroides sculpturatus]
MTSMSEERRKEMEEEMNRFEQEIAFPGDPSHPRNSPLSNVPESNTDNSNIDNNEIIEVCAEPSITPPPAVVNENELVPLTAKAPPPPQDSQMNHPQFIPHQLQRGPPPSHPSFRPFGGMRGPPGPPGPPGMHGHHGPQGMQRPPPVMMRPMHSNMPGPGPMQPPMGPMGPGPMGSGPMNMNMHHSGGPMNMGMHPGPMPPMGPNYSNPMSGPIHPAMSQPMPHNFNNGVNSSPPVTTQLPSSLNSSAIMSSPAIYAAPPMKSLHTDKMGNGRTMESSSGLNISTSQKIDRHHAGKSSDDHSNQLYFGGTEEMIFSKKREKKRKVVRMAGGQVWEDNSLHEWEGDDFRIFCGDLGNDVTDEVLTRAFSKFGSFIKAKVIRDKRTNKTKGFGFVSFKDPQDFIKAMREMNGKRKNNFNL